MEQFEKYIEDAGHELMHYAMLLTSDKADATLLYQSTIEKARRNIADTKVSKVANGNFGGYLHAIMQSVVLWRSV